MHTQKPFSVRCYEILPGFLVWFTFLLGIILSFVRPLWVIYFIIFFDLYWLCRVLYFVVILLFAWRKYHASLGIDWFGKLTEKSGWHDIYHLIFLPLSKEGWDIVDTTLQALQNTRYPKEKYIIVLAGEERAHEHFQKVANMAKEKYANVFFKFFITEHPDGMPGELAAKGANIHYAGREAQKEIDILGIPYEKIIVSAFDIDTIVHPDYFACLTATYLEQKNPTRTSYQPVVLYNNTIWNAYAPMRLAAFSTTFWLMTELARPDRLFTFSSHSMSFRALVDVGFWQKDVVSEDSRIFLQCVMRYDGEYTVVPLYIPVSMDTVTAEKPLKSFMNLYKQQRRWAWGVEHFPYMIEEFKKHSRISFWKKVRMLWLQAEGMYTWATAPILIFLLGRLPLIFSHTSAYTTVIAQNAPYILEWLLNISMAGIFVIAFLSLSLLPPRPTETHISRWITMVGQWVLLPVTIIIFSAVPAIDAQTRLMFGKYLGFYVTEKKR
jgi:hypothetical protein